MENSMIQLRDIRPGHLIIEDVFANTNFPIIRKNTRVTSTHIDVLKVFDIKEVKIDKPTIERKELVKDESVQVINPDEIIGQLETEQEVFQERFDEATKNYKKEFNGWRSGIKPDVAKIRAMILPLVEKFCEEQSLITSLADFTYLEDYLYQHSLSVGLLAAAIAKELDFPIGEVYQLGVAGVLADAGMAKIDMSILNKAAFLTTEEFNEIKKHSLYSYQMIQDTPLIRQDMKVAILQHHERLDGSGYPRGDKDGKITIYAQIIAVADVYHAMTSERVYRAKESPYKVIEMLMEEKFGEFDAKVVQALFNLINHLSIGMEVKLSNGMEGIIIQLHDDLPLRPTIKLSKDQTIVDLSVSQDLVIISTVN